MRCRGPAWPLPRQPADCSAALRCPATRRCQTPRARSRASRLSLRLGGCPPTGVRLQRCGAFLLSAVVTAQELSAGNLKILWLSTGAPAVIPRREPLSTLAVHRQAAEMADRARLPVSTSKPADRAWEHVAVLVIAWTSGLVHGVPGVAHDGDPAGGDESVESRGEEHMRQAEDADAEAAGQPAEGAGDLRAFRRRRRSERSRDSRRRRTPRRGSSGASCRYGGRRLTRVDEHVQPGEREQRQRMGDC